MGQTRRRRVAGSRSGGSGGGAGLGADRGRGDASALDREHAAMAVWRRRTGSMRTWTPSGRSPVLDPPAGSRSSVRQRHRVPVVALAAGARGRGRPADRRRGPRPPGHRPGTARSTPRTRTAHWPPRDSRHTVRAAFQPRAVPEELVDRMQRERAPSAGSSRSPGPRRRSRPSSSSPAPRRWSGDPATSPSCGAGCGPTPPRSTVSRWTPCRPRTRTPAVELADPRLRRRPAGGAVDLPRGRGRGRAAAGRRAAHRRAHGHRGR